MERVSLACVQCRSRRVKCDGAQPMCGRCQRDTKECTYQASRRGGLDKAALAKRRARLQREAEAATLSRHPDGEPEPQPTPLPEALPSQLTVVSGNHRLLELYYEHFWQPYPVVLPYQYFLARLLGNPNHGLMALMNVLQWIGSVYAPWTSAEPYAHIALQSLQQLEDTPFNVQALMLFAVSRHHWDSREEANAVMNSAVNMGLRLRMNEKGFAHAYCEGDMILAESWRRTYFMLYYFDQQFTVVAKSLSFTLIDIQNTVDLPCDDEQYESGHIPRSPSLEEFSDREFAETEVVYSSMAYMHDMNLLLTSVMKMVLESGTFSASLANVVDTKVASWQALLPHSKQDPLRFDGTVDEVMWQCHVSAAILLTVHRPYSALIYSPEEFTTQSFMILAPVIAPIVTKRASHTARALKGLESYTKLLSIPSPAERHSLFSMSIAAQMATAQISACKNLLEDQALAIGRDRLRLGIGYLNAMGTYWPLGKKMAQEVKAIARSALSKVPEPMQQNSAAEIELPRDPIVWHTNQSTHIDIYAGTVLPTDWAALSSGYASSASSNRDGSIHSSHENLSPWQHRDSL